MNLYEILGLSQDCSTEEAGKAGRKMSASLHPDRVGNNSTSHLFDQVVQARDTLTNPEKRAAYDRELAQQQAAKDFSFTDSHRIITDLELLSYEVFVDDLMGTVRQVDASARQMNLPQDGVGTIGLTPGQMAYGGDLELGGGTVAHIEKNTKAGGLVSVTFPGGQDTVRAVATDKIPGEFYFNGFVFVQTTLTQEQLRAGGSWSIDIEGAGVKNFQCQPADHPYTMYFDGHLIVLCILEDDDD